MEQKSLKELYLEEKEKPNPAQVENPGGGDHVTRSAFDPL